MGICEFKKKDKEEIWETTHLLQVILVAAHNLRRRPTDLFCLCRHCLLNRYSPPSVLCMNNVPWDHEASVLYIGIPTFVIGSQEWYVHLAKSIMGFQIHLKASWWATKRTCSSPIWRLCSSFHYFHLDTLEKNLMNTLLYIFFKTR